MNAVYCCSCKNSSCKKGFGVHGDKKTTTHSCPYCSTVHRVCPRCYQTFTGTSMQSNLIRHMKKDLCFNKKRKVSTTATEFGFHEDSPEPPEPPAANINTPVDMDVQHDGFDASVEWDDDIYGFPDENDVEINTAIENLAGAMHSALSEKEGGVARCGATGVPGGEENLSGKEDENDKNGNTNKLPFKAFSYFEKKESAAYHYQNHHEMLGGLRGVVFRSSQSVINAANHLAYYCLDRYADVKESVHLFEITLLLLDLPGSMMTRFLRVMAQRDSFHSTPMLSETAFPYDRDSANRLCLICKNAVVTNVPSLNVFDIAGHACVSLGGLLDLKCANGVEFDYIQDHEGDISKEGINGTEAAIQMLERVKDYIKKESADQEARKDQDAEKTAVGYLIFWSDGFLRSFIRQKHNGIWILTVTICPPNGESTSDFHTYVLAIGRTGQDHNKVIDYYLNELKQIRCGKLRYHGGDLKEMIYSAFDLIAYIADRPERDSIMQTLHLGTFGKRSLHSGKVDAKVFPSCDNCFKKLLLQAQDPSETSVFNCQQCCNWDVGTDSNAKKYDKVDGQDYPTNTSLNEADLPLHRRIPATHLLPYPLSFDDLRRGAMGGFYGYAFDGWSKKEFDFYMRSCNVNQSLSTDIYQAAKNAKEGGGGDQTAVFRALLPELWLSDYTIDIFIDAPMHQLFHGIIPAVMAMIESFLTDHRKWSEFMEFINPYINQIAQLRLDWCSVKGLPNSNWLAEDALGFARVIIFVYGQFFLNMNLPASVNTSETTRLILAQIIHSLHVMMCLLMSNKKICPDIIEVHIKIFLSSCTRFSESYHDDSIKQFWEDKGNFISLLNLPKQIKKFGHLRLWYEGVRERFIQKPKAVLLNLRQSPSFLIMKMNLLHKNYQLDWMKKEMSENPILKEIISENPQFSGTTEKKQQKRQVYIYKVEDDITGAFDKGIVLCGITIELAGRSNEIHIPYQDGRYKIKLHSLEYSLRKPDEYCGMHYFQFEPSIRNADQREMSFDRTSMHGCTTRYVMLLPLKQNNMPFSQHYAVISHDWNVLLPNGEMDIPGIIMELFQDNYKL